jgi:hypothetical protein
MDTPLAKVQLRKYLSKYDYLENEYLETKMLFEEYNKKFLEEYYTQEELEDYKKSALSKTPCQGDTKDTPSPLDDTLDADTPGTDTDTDTPPAVKTLYRKLSLLKHPDKVPGKEETFKEINRAYKTREFAVLIKIAMELGVEIVFFTELPSLFDKTLKGLEESIQSLKQTLAWHWAHASDSEKELYRAQMR